MKTFTLALGAVAHVYAKCADDGWCNFGALDGFYKCNTDGEDFDPGCLKSRLSKKDDHNSYIEFEYKLPALSDGVEEGVRNYQEFDTPIAPKQATEETDNYALFKLASNLAFDGNTVAYLGVMQALAFTEVKTKAIEMPDIPGVSPNLKPCWAEPNDDGSCSEKTFAAGSYKYSFAGYQTVDCQNPDDCFFFLRSTIDVSTLDQELETIYFNNDKGLTAATTSHVGVDHVIKSIHLADQVITFPTGVNYNNNKAEWQANGCSVHLEKVSENDKIHLAFKVRTPGAGKFFMYDPTVSSKTMDFGAAVPSAATSMLAVVMLAFAAMCA